jgi:hypothetical protein
MSDVPPAGGTIPPNGSTAVPPFEQRAAFPAVRLLYAIGFGIVAWFVFWLTVLIALVQFVLVAVNGRVNDELRNFTIALVQYLWELVAFITFVRDDQPFPVGPFPKHP